jgi:hypothetical protein
MLAWKERKHPLTSPDCTNTRVEEAEGSTGASDRVQETDRRGPDATMCVRAAYARRHLPLAMHHNGSLLSESCNETDVRTPGTPARLSGHQRMLVQPNDMEFSGERSESAATTG